MVRGTLPSPSNSRSGMGGYSNVKTDRGGPTKYGITQRTAALRRCLPIRSGR